MPVEEISITEAAERKGCARRTIHNAINRGDFRAKRIGARIIVVIADWQFDAWEPEERGRRVEREDENGD